MVVQAIKKLITQLLAGNVVHFRLHGKRFKQLGTFT